MGSKNDKWVYYLAESLHMKHKIAAFSVRPNDEFSKSIQIEAALNKSFHLSLRIEDQL